MNSKKIFLLFVVVLLGLPVLSHKSIQAGPNMYQDDYVGIKKLTIPILAKTDITIVESTLAGCYLAIELSRRGLDVILCSSGSSLPRGIAVCMRSWITENELNALPQELYQLFIKNAKYKTEKGEYILHAGKISEGLEDMLLDAGVQIYYDFVPCKVTTNQNNAISDIFFGGKCGIQAIQTKGLIDCTPHSILSRLSHASYIYRYSVDDSIVVSQNMLTAWEKSLIDSLSLESEKYFNGERKSIPEVSKSKNISIENVNYPQGQKISMHGQNAEFKLKLSIDPSRADYHSDVILKTRKLIYQASSHLNQLDIDSTFFYRPSDDVIMPSLVRIQSHGRNKDWGKLDFIEKAELCKPAAIENLWICNPSIDVSNVTSAYLNNPYYAFEIAGILLKSIPAKLRSVNINYAEPQVSTIIKGKYNVKSGDVPPLYSTGKSVKLSPFQIPVLSNVDILIVGGGTSGLPAALTASDQDLSIMLIEKHSELGGTHTLGGVGSYWYGHETPFLKRLEQTYQLKIKQSNLYKAAAMLETLNKKRVRVLLKTAVVGSIIGNDGSQINGVVISTPLGLKAVMARCIIDATGDGDIAAWSGADNDYGNGRDAFTMWCSFGKYNVPYSNVSRKYFSVVELRDITDLSRVKITARRRVGIFGVGEYPQHYFTVRESRHIAGKDTVTYGKILSGKRYSDLMIRCKSNFDIKGIASSDLVRSGFVCWNYKQNFECGIPYSAIVPEHLENILVIGKAYSATHDAISLARMQRDMIAMGGAAGLAASIAVKNHVPPSGINILNFQKTLMEYGLLMKEDIAEFGEPVITSCQSISTKLDSFLIKKEMHPADLVSVLMYGRGSVPFLKKAFVEEKDVKKKLQLARGLCYLNDTTGVDFLLNNIKVTTRDSLPPAKLESSWIRKIGPPDHGWAPDAAYSIYAIGLTELGYKLTPVLSDIIDKIENMDDFEYVLSICQAAERSGSKKFIPLLNKLSRKEFLSGLSLPIGNDPRNTVDVLSERLAYLEFSTGRALARCGSELGYEIIITYLLDMRGFIARSAFEELVDITGKDFGFDPEKWSEWLISNKENLTPKPFSKKIH